MMLSFLVGLIVLAGVGALMGIAQYMMDLSFSPLDVLGFIIALCFMAGACLTVGILARKVIGF